jgi:rubrerythrin
MFNVQEVFHIAIQIEANAADFYRRAAERHAGEGADYLLALADMEQEHKAAFTAMRDAYLAEERPEPIDLSNDGGMYLSAIASGFPVEGSPEVALQFDGKESLLDIVKKAIGLEKEAILLYLGIKDVVPEELGRDRIDAIIDQEKQHIIELSRKRAELEK